MPPRPPPSAASDRPTHIGVELRLTSEEADALELFLGKFADMIDAEVVSCPPGTREPLLEAMKKLLRQLTDALPPFE